MIVRISTEGQYQVPGALLDNLNALDTRAIEAIAAGDEPQFKRLYDEMISLVRKRGERLPPDTITESDVILPPPDISMEDARKLFRGHGLVPG
ncbi:MAG: hypothetical protein M1370_07330 [Bacteroidetes bacterium]|nr:hypothetical protein [Bacteroidota bacterium]